MGLPRMLRFKRSLRRSLNGARVRAVRRLSVGWMFIIVSSGLTGCSNSQRQAPEPERIAVHTHQIDGLTVRTGDLICTSTGGKSMFTGFLWRAFGMVIPGAVDHIAVYVGPGGRCVEAGAKLRVITFDVTGNTWDESKMSKQRGPLFDALYGVAYPLAGRSLSREEEARIRRGVASYCLKQAEAKKPYNPVFTESMTENAFYCSQLAYKAYLGQGLDLNTGQGVPHIPGTDSIVFPQEIWSGCEHERAANRPPGS
ncbi:MAG: hypothetical protein A2Y76_14605 [Planctomycetes bacterium RBG_13_60_9]|nr:MAG: hypothetical protein A2Y76_14605 [Planctomycetes bacterium RBG_13_60_9]